MSGKEMKPRSHEVTDGYVRAGARAMLRAVGMTDDDWDKPQIGVASSWNEVTPCNMSLDRLAKVAKKGVREAGGFPLEFMTIPGSRGISIGPQGLRAVPGRRGVIAGPARAVSEALGMSLPGSASPPAVDRRRDDFAFESGRAVVRLLEAGIRPRQILTKEAFENAIAVVMALGGSTNAVLHLLAIANEARVELELDDFNRIGARVAHVADMKPHGKYHMADLDRVGGVQVVDRK